MKTDDIHYKVLGLLRGGEVKTGRELREGIQYVGHPSGFYAKFFELEITGLITRTTVDQPGRTRTFYGITEDGQEAYDRVHSRRKTASVDERSGQKS